MVSACGSGGATTTQAPPNLPNIAQIENAIAHTILADDHVTATVTCPALVPQIQGQVFTCVGISRRPKAQGFSFQVTLHSGTFVSYQRTS